MSGILRALHVEDDDDIIMIVRLSLNLDGGFDIRVARTETAAMAILDDSLWAPDVVLLDVQLGATSGLALLQKFKAEGLRLPVIVMTASIAQDQIDRYLNLGADGVIAKPFDPLTLGDQIRRKLVAR